MNKNELHSINNVIKYNVYRIKRSYGRVINMSFEDLYQAGYLGYLNAQKNYNPQYGKMSLKYASLYIKDEMNKYIQKEIKYRNTHDTSLSDDSSEEIENYADSTESKISNNEELLNRIKLGIKYLTPKERYIIENIYLNDAPKKHKQLAEELKCTENAVKLAKSTAIKKLRLKLCLDV